MVECHLQPYFSKRILLDVTHQPKTVFWMAAMDDAAIRSEVARAHVLLRRKWYRAAAIFDANVEERDVVVGLEQVAVNGIFSHLRQPLVAREPTFVVGNPADFPKRPQHRTANVK